MTPEIPTSDDKPLPIRECFCVDCGLVGQQGAKLFVVFLHAARQPPPKGDLPRQLLYERLLGRFPKNKLGTKRELR